MLQAAVLWMTLLWMCSAAATAAETNEWRPCRAAGHRRYDEDVMLRNRGGGDGDGDGDGGRSDEDDDDNDDDSGGETSANNAGDSGYFRFPVDDKPKRGAGKAYEKKQDLYRPAAHASYAPDVASENGLRVDTTLLRGETIELPTYVNVPVTLRCRFEPADGTDDKFNTVVEAMYPGHRDAPPPPPGSHAFRILKQLMSSADGWRGVAHNSARSVRRASGNRFGRHEWPARNDEVGDDDSRTAQRDDQMFWNILARQRAAERMRRFHDSRQDVSWPERFRGQSARLLQRFDGPPVAIRKWSENQLIEDQEAEQDVYDQQFGGRLSEPVYDLQVEPQIDDSQHVESADDSQQLESVDDFQQAESVDDSQQVESFGDSEQVESSDDSRQVESSDESQQLESSSDSQQVESFDDSQQVEPAEHRTAAEDVDDGRVQSRSLPAVAQYLQHDMMTATSAPEIATTITSDLEKFRKGIPTRIYTEHAYTTDSTS